MEVQLVLNPKILPCQPTALDPLSHNNKHFKRKSDTVNKNFNVLPDQAIRVAPNHPLMDEAHPNTTYH